jgi:hypothetical protein
MSTPNESTRRMSTRVGARDKMAKVIERLRSGGIAEEDSNLNGGPGEDTATALVNDEEDNGEDTQLSKRKTANATRAAKRKPSKKASTPAVKKPKASKKPKTSKGVDAAAQKAKASKLAELEDRYQKKYEDARSSHPRHWTGKAPGSSHIFDSLTDHQSANCVFTGQSDSDVDNCDLDKLNVFQDLSPSPSPGPGPGPGPGPSPGLSPSPSLESMNGE